MFQIDEEQELTKNLEDPNGMAALLNDYLEWLLMMNYSKETAKNHRHNIGYLITWCEERGITKPNEVTLPILDRYRRSVFYYRKENGDPLCPRSQYTRLSPIKVFFKWLTKNRYILYNPASELELPKVDSQLPKQLLTDKETEVVLNQPNVNKPLGIRDRAILETLYSTGMRRMELIRLNRRDIDINRGTVMIRKGKGKKDRMIPIGERALVWIRKYQNDVRPSYVVEPDDGTVFLSTYGNPISKSTLSRLAGMYVDKADLGKSGACHLFRHTMATLMLENGADIRYIQQMLGHALLNTTQIYTKVAIHKLKDVHTSTHPGAKFKPKSD